MWQGIRPLLVPRLHLGPRQRLIPTLAQLRRRTPITQDVKSNAAMGFRNASAIGQVMAIGIICAGLLVAHRRLHPKVVPRRHMSPRQRLIPTLAQLRRGTHITQDVKSNAAMSFRNASAIGQVTATGITCAGLLVAHGRLQVRKTRPALGHGISAAGRIGVALHGALQDTHVRREMTGIPSA